MKMKRVYPMMLLGLFVFSCTSEEKEPVQENPIKTDVVEAEPEEAEVFPNAITIEGMALNPEGIEFNKNDNTFFLSSLNAAPIVKVNLDGTFKPFTSGEQYPMSTAGLQIDYKNNRLLAAGFNGMELFDEDPATKGMANLRVYNLETGVIEQDVNLSFLVPDAMAYYANDIAIDDAGNAYVSDWYARVVYKVDLEGNASLFWSNNSSIQGGPNGLDVHPDGYLLVSVINDGTYSEHGLVKVPLKDPNSATTVEISDAAFAGFDGLVVQTNGNVVGVSNNGTVPGGNTLVELSGNNDWASAEVINFKAITTSTTVAVTPENMMYVINQDFLNAFAETWTIERIEF